MNNNDISFNIDWNVLQDFNTKYSAVKGTWITAFYNDGCKRKGIKCWADFYAILGVDFSKINPKDGHKMRRLRPEELRANEQTVEKIQEFIKSQYHPTKYKGRQPSAIAMDYLQFSPYSDNDIPNDTIVIRIDNTIEWNHLIDYYDMEVN